MAAMERNPTFLVRKGFEEAHRAVAAALFWQAFQRKLNHVMGPEAKALQFLRSVIDPDYAIAAVSAEGQLLGLAGFKTADGSLVGGSLRDLAQSYGYFSALWRAPLLSLLERKVSADTLLMDGIFVAEAARGGGIGARLLDAIKAEAEARGLAKVRLDVIDSNPRARALYERQGFVADGEEELGPLRHLFGFRRSTKMVWKAAS